MQPDATKHTRHDKGAADTRVVQGFHAKVITGTQQPPVRRVPQAEREISDQPRDTVVAPGRIRAYKQGRIGELLDVGLPIGAGEIGDEPFAIVESAIEDSPHAGGGATDGHSDIASVRRNGQPDVALDAEMSVERLTC